MKAAVLRGVEKPLTIEDVQIATAVGATAR
jgi:hypothetical protein